MATRSVSFIFLQEGFTDSRAQVSWSKSPDGSVGLSKKKMK